MMFAMITLKVLRMEAQTVGIDAFPAKNWIFTRLAQHAKFVVVAVFAVGLLSKNDEMSDIHILLTHSTLFSPSLSLDLPYLRLHKIFRRRLLQMPCDTCRTQSTEDDICAPLRVSPQCQHVWCTWGMTGTQGQNQLRNMCFC